MSIRNELVKNLHNIMKPVKMRYILKRKNIPRYNGMLKSTEQCFPGGSVVKNPSAIIKDTGSIGSTCHRTTKPVCHDYWACTLAWMWGCSSRPLLLRHSLVLSATAPDLGHGVAPLGHASASSAAAGALQRLQSHLSVRRMWWQGSSIKECLILTAGSNDSNWQGEYNGRPFHVC